FIPQCLTEPTVGMLQQPERFEYDDFRRKLQYIIEVYKGNPEKYYKVSLNALSTFAVKASVERALSEYYHRLAKIWR
ncbi:MAG: hypothetical protein QXY08_03055, partial [Nitrososphaerales archaeon]